jgi:hypothetical protein
VRLLLAFALAVLFASVSLAAGTLDVYVIDTEGGKAVILVTPAGGTMLIDAGYPRQDNRDTERIVATARSLGRGRMKKTASTEAAGCTIDGARDAKKEILVRWPKWARACGQTN